VKIGVFDPYLDTLGGGEKYMLTAASYLSKKHETFLFWNDKDIIKKASSRFGLDLSNIKEAKNIFTPGLNFPERYLKSRRYDSILYISDGSLPLIKSSLYVVFQFPLEWVDVNFFTKIKVRRVKKFICYSEYVKKFIDRKFNVESVVLYPPAYSKKDFPKTDFKKKKNYILSVGRLSRLSNGGLFKKQDFMINAFKKIVDSGFRDWDLRLVVNYLDRDKQIVDTLKKMTKGYPIEVLENISLEKLNDLYASAKIYWHASGFGEDLNKYPERAEHFGISTVEGMANGLVPVVINEGGQKEIVDDSENGFLWNSEEELIKKTKDLIENQKMLMDLAVKAIKKAEDFTTDKFYDRLFDIFKNE
jgi:glycosyltransferase involved in cell wall biosynthesis